MFGNCPGDYMLDDLLALGDLSGLGRYYRQTRDSLIFGSPSYINNKNINIKKMTYVKLLIVRKV